MCVAELPRSVNQLDDHAQSEMVLAATYAGVGFGNAGVHLWYAGTVPASLNQRVRCRAHVLLPCGRGSRSARSHGLSYPISGLNRQYRQPEYEVDHPLVVRALDASTHKSASS